MDVTRKQNMVCVSEGKKCSFFGKFGGHCFLVTPVLRLAFLFYYRQNMPYNDSKPLHIVYWGVYITIFFQWWTWADYKIVSEVKITLYSLLLLPISHKHKHDGFVGSPLHTKVNTLYHATKNGDFKHHPDQLFIEKYFNIL